MESVYDKFGLSKDEITKMQNEVMDYFNLANHYQLHIKIMGSDAFKALNDPNSIVRYCKSIQKIHKFVSRKTKIKNL